MDKHHESYMLDLNSYEGQNRLQTFRPIHTDINVFRKQMKCELKWWNVIQMMGYL